MGESTSCILNKLLHFRVGKTESGKRHEEGVTKITGDISSEMTT